MIFGGFLRTGGNSPGFLRTMEPPLSDNPSFMLACESGNYAAVSSLLRNGERVNQHDSKGLTPLHLAARQGHRKLVDVLIESGAFLNAQTHMGETPLHFAAMNGNEEVVTALLDAGADASIEDASGQLPMHYAEFRGHDALVNYLIPRSVSAACTPASIFNAILSRDMNQLVLLCAKFGPNVCENGSYPVHFALRKNRSEALPTLLKAGADFTLRSKGSQPLHIAADKGMDNAVRFLLRHGADVNDVNTSNGYTPLHFAVVKGNLSTVTLLMQNGANPMISSGRGQSCLEIALYSVGPDLLGAMMEGGLLKKVKAETLLNYALQARKFSLSFMLSVLGRKSWSPLMEMDRMVTPNQARLMTARSPEFSLKIIKDNIDSDKLETAWAALDSL